MAYAATIARHYARQARQGLMDGAELRAAWESAKENRRARGPLKVAVQMLRRVGTDPRGPRIWATERGVVTDLADGRGVVDTVVEEAIRALWRRAAASRRDTQGAEGGVHAAASLQGVKKAKGIAGHIGCAGPAAEGLGRCILAGGTWPAARVHETDGHASQACPRCGAERETALHRWYECPAPELVHCRSQVGALPLIEEGRRAGFAPACLWECGLVPPPSG